MIQKSCAGIARFLLAPLSIVALTASTGWTADFKWTALPDRERVTISLAPSEGVAGAVDRIAPTGLLIPFTEVPPGVYINKTPEGAKLFKETKQLGRSLVLVTQTDQFGFLILKQTPSELVVDFFPDPLGARWKPTRKAPTTEVAPDYGVPTNQPAVALPQSLVVESPSQPPAQSQPEQQAQPPQQGQPAAQAQPVSAAEPQILQQAVPDETAPQTAPAPVEQPPVPVQQTASRPANAPAHASPTVVVLPGTPEHAAAVTQLVQPPHVEGAPVPAVPQSTAAPAVPPATPSFIPPSVPQGAAQSAPAPQAAPSGEPAPVRPFLDSRVETSPRSAPLPMPAPPLSTPAPAIGGQPAPVQAVPAQAQPVQAQPVQPQQPVPAQTAPQPVQKQAQPVSAVPQAAPQSQPAVPAAAPQAAPSPAVPPQAAVPQAASAPPVPLPPGVGVRTDGAATYGGTINTGGLENIPALPPGGIPAQPAAATPAATAVPATAAASPPVVATPAPAPTAGAPAVTPPSVAVPATAAQTPAQPQAPAAQAAAAPAATPAAPAAQGTPPAHDAAAGKPSANATAPGAQNATKVIYVDKDGKPVEPPADPAVMIPEIRKDITAGEFAKALEKSNLLLAQGKVDRDQREEVLHMRAEMLFAINKDHLEDHYKEISDATAQAINFNQQSRRNAGALLRLGYVNLKLKNIPEAEARFNMLRRQFPDDENVPLTYYYWGDYHFGRNELQKAADEFQYLLQEYPNSRYAREAALGLARSFYRLGYYEPSFNVVDYIERRWSRFYIEYPPFLNMMGDVAFRLNKLDYALKHYWLYVNLEPEGDEADIILTRIGDIYSMMREKNAAKEMYNECVRRFPDKDGALVAMMRLAEEGVNDDPSIAGMFSIFDGPFSLAPAEVYRTIIEKHPQSALVPLAQIKLAMWHLWKHEFLQTLDVCSDFLEKNPNHELVPKAREIALQTFAILSAESVAEGRYARMREIWERYPIVHDQGEILPPESRVALGVSYWKDGKPDDALKTIEPFFLGNKVPQYSEMALSLVLSIYLEYDQWSSIREVAKRVELWELSDESKQQLDYALALAGENLGESEQVAAIWNKLYESGNLPAAQMAYAAYFLAKDAEKNRELERAYTLGTEALKRLTEQAERTPNTADVGKIQSQLASLMDIAETAGRLREALDFAGRYMQYLAPDAPERVAIMYRTSRIYKKQGNVDAWKKTLTEIATKYPTTVHGQTAASELKSAGIAEDAAKYSPTGRL